MKNAASILSVLSVKKQFKPLSHHSCYKKFMDLLPPRFQRAISFVFVRDDTLFLALSHPGYKMELNYNKDVLKSLLTLFSAENGECSFMQVKDLVVFVSRYAPPPDGYGGETSPSVPRYGELARGRFEIEVENEKLRERFERIRDIVSSARRGS
jgi:hypothetical protein